MILLFGLLLLAFQLFGRDVAALQPVVSVGVPALLWMAVIWGLALGPLQRRTHRFPLAQLVLLVVLILIIVTVPIGVLSLLGAAMDA